MFDIVHLVSFWTGSRHEYLTCRGDKATETWPHAGCVGEALKKSNGSGCEASVEGGSTIGSHFSSARHKIRRYQVRLRSEGLRVARGSHQRAKQEKSSTGRACTLLEPGTTCNSTPICPIEYENTRINTQIIRRSKNYRIERCSHTTCQQPHFPFCSAKQRTISLLKPTCFQVQQNCTTKRWFNWKSTTTEIFFNSYFAEKYLINFPPNATRG